MKIYAVFALALLAGCRSTPTPEQAAARQEVKMQKLTTHRFAVCMDEALGPFGAFASPSTRQQATEQCKSVMQASAPMTHP